MSVTVLALSSRRASRSAVSLLHLLLAELDIQLLVLDLLVEVVELAVVAHFLLLLLVARDAGEGVLGAYTVVGHTYLHVLDLSFNILEAGA